MNEIAHKLEDSFRFQNRELLDNYVILATTDIDGKINHVSTNLCNLFGYKSSELEGNSYSFLISKDALKIFENQFNDALVNKSIWKGEIKHASKSDHVIWTDTIITPLFDKENGEHIGFIFASVDITKEKTLKKINEENLLKKKYDKDILDFMPNLTSAVLLKNSSSLHKVLWIITFFIFSFIVWANVSRIDDLVRTSGKIITTQNIQIISSLEGGILKKMNVKEGDKVKKGDVILTLSDTLLQSDFNTKYAQKVSLLAKMKRLDAEAYNKFISQDTQVIKTNKDLMNYELGLYETNKNKLSTSIKILNEKLAQKRSELVENKDKKVIIEKNLTLLLKEFRIKKDLLEEKIISKVEFLQLQRKINDTEIEQNKVIAAIAANNSEIKELQQNIKETKIDFEKDAKNDITDTYAELLRLNEELATIKSKIERTIIKASSDGIVNVINVKTPGEAVSSGKVLVQIIPDTDELLAEVKVTPADIGFLYLGQQVKMKFQAYDFSLYGGMMGEISYISADTIMSEKDKEELYTVYVKSNKTYLGTNEKLTVKPGMTVDADIIIGQKTIMQFILKPIMKTLQIEKS